MAFLISLVVIVVDQIARNEVDVLHFDLMQGRGHGLVAFWVLNQKFRSSQKSRVHSETAETATDICAWAQTYVQTCVHTCVRTCVHTCV